MSDPNIDVYDALKQAGVNDDLARTAQPQEIFWDNGGSLMRTVDDGYKVVVLYETVRPSLRPTIPVGAVAFEGVRVNGNGIVGNAYVYTKYCYGTPFPYQMNGIINGVIDVWGPAAVVDPNSCTIVGYRPDSDNAHRTFQIPLVEEGNYFPER